MTHRFVAIFTVKILSSHQRTLIGMHVGTRKPVSRLIMDSFFLVLCIVLLLVDVLIAQDVFLALLALGGAFVFSIRVGRDVRSRRVQ